MPDLLVKKSPLEERIYRRQSVSYGLYAILFLFFLALAAYGGLRALNRSQEQARQEILAQVQAREQELRPELSNQILTLDSQLKNVRSVFLERPSPTNVLKLLESDTYPQVRFLSFSFSAPTRELTLTGETTSYTTLTQQISLLERDPQVERVGFGGLSLGTSGLVSFRMTITVKPSLLTLRP